DPVGDLLKGGPRVVHLREKGLVPNDPEPDGLVGRDSAVTPVIVNRADLVAAAVMAIWFQFPVPVHSDIREHPQAAETAGSICLNLAQTLFALLVLATAKCLDPSP